MNTIYFKSYKLTLLFILINTFIHHQTLAQQPNDCINSIIACGNSDISLDANGFGIQELFGNTNICGTGGTSLGEKP